MLRVKQGVEICKGLPEFFVFLFYCGVTLVGLVLQIAAIVAVAVVVIAIAVWAFRYLF